VACQLTCLLFTYVRLGLVKKKKKLVQFTTFIWVQYTLLRMPDGSLTCTSPVAEIPRRLTGSRGQNDAPHRQVGRYGRAEVHTVCWCFDDTYEKPIEEVMGADTTRLYTI
jgi:hypothetical protein